MKFRIYIDEVGNPDLESSENPNHRFLSLSGVILELDYVQRVVHPQMENLKSRYFSYHPDEPVIIHRAEMVNALPPFQALKDSQLRQSFDDELLRLLEAWDYTIISVCLDKKKHKETYAVGATTLTIIACRFYSNGSSSFLIGGLLRATPWPSRGSEKRIGV